MDEKSSDGAWPLPPRTDTLHRSRPRFRFAVLCLGIAVLLWLTDVRLLNHGPCETNPAAPGYDPMNPWDSINPSPELEWHPCYTAINPLFRCARFTVPMDYDRHSSGAFSPDANDANPKVHLALLLLLPSHLQNLTLATNPAPGPLKVKNPLLINPGGPGGSGVLAALLLGPSLQRILGADQPVLGFDPRGVQFTTPRADCWPTPSAAGECGSSSSSSSSNGNGNIRNGGGGGGGRGKCDDNQEEDATRGLMHRVEWENANVAAWGLISESDAAGRFLDVAQRGVNQLCKERDVRLERGKSGLRFVGTRSVARDMLGIVDAWDRWVGRQDGWQAADGEMKGKLVYWGFSYGTYLGMTFARMFPDRVGRLLLDGAVDAEFYESPIWKESLIDADKVLGQFFRYCAEAGTRCELYRPGDAADDVRRRYEQVMEKLETRPATFTHPEYFFPVILRASYVKKLVFAVLYSPIGGFPSLAAVLNYVYEGKYGLLAALFQDAQLQCSLTANPAISDAQRAIMCGDKTEPVNLTLPEVTAAYEAMASTSQFADVWMNLMMMCNGWDVSWQRQQPREQPAWTEQVETASPILFLSNTYDPVTPLHAAVKMALRFKDAGLLEQQSQGHCTISTVSRCTAKVVREYVLSGEVPPPPKPEKHNGEYEGQWARCGVDEVPWRSVDVNEIETAEEKETVEAWQKMQRVMRSMQKWGVGREKGLDMEAVMALAKDNRRFR